MTLVSTLHRLTIVILLLWSVFAFGQDTSGSNKPKAQAAPNQDFATQRPQLPAIDILSDTLGVDFRPYLRRILQDIRQNWYPLIPESVEMKKGKLAIEFAITKEGKLQDMHLVASSGDVDLDRPAWGSIVTSNPFPPLPSEFTGPYLALRFHFYYNPDKGDLTQSPSESADKINLTPKLPQIQQLPLPLDPSSRAVWVQKGCPAASGVAVCINAPSDLEVPAGGSKIITATVAGAKERAVDWIVECSGPVCGKMANDMYTAPIVRPNPPVVTLTAVSKADPSAKASVTIHLVRPTPQIPSKP